MRRLELPVRRSTPAAHRDSGPTGADRQHLRRPCRGEEQTRIVRLAQHAAATLGSTESRARRPENAPLRTAGFEPTGPLPGAVAIGLAPRRSGGISRRTSFWPFKRNRQRSPSACGAAACARSDMLHDCFCCQRDQHRPCNSSCSGRASQGRRHPLSRPRSLLPRR